MYRSIQLLVKWLGLWRPFGCLGLLSGSEMGQSTAKTGVSRYPWSFLGTRAAPVARLLSVDADISALGSQAKSLGHPVLFESLVGPCMMLTVYPQNTARGHESPACQHAIHDLMAIILCQNTTCDVYTLYTKFSCDVRALGQCGWLVWPQIRQKTADTPHFFRLFRGSA